MLVGGLFGALAVLAHVGNAEGRASRWPPRWLAPLSLLVSMLASETSLAAVALLASYELFAVDGALGRRFLKAAPWAAAGLVYVGLYAAAGYGVTHSGLYISPFGDPRAFPRRGRDTPADLAGRARFRRAVVPVGARGAGATRTRSARRNDGRRSLLVSRGPGLFERR